MSLPSFTTLTLIPFLNTLSFFVIYILNYMHFCIHWHGKMFFVTDRNKNIFVLGSPYNSFCKVNQFGGLRLCKSSPLSEKGGKGGAYYTKAKTRACLRSNL